MIAITSFFFALVGPNTCMLNAATEKEFDSTGFACTMVRTRNRTPRERTLILDSCRDAGTRNDR